MDSNTSYIMTFTHINNDYILPNLYFVSLDYENDKNNDDNLIFRSNNNSDKIHKMHQVLYSTKQYFSNGTLATIKHISNSCEYSQYIIYDGEFTFIDSNDGINKNILGLNSINIEYMMYNH